MRSLELDTPGGRAQLRLRLEALRRRAWDYHLRFRPGDLVATGYGMPEFAEEFGDLPDDFGGIGVVTWVDSLPVGCDPWPCIRVSLSDGTECKSFTYLWCQVQNSQRWW